MIDDPAQRVSTSNRYYDPARGRFTTPDPAASGTIARPNSWNRYAYTEGDPVNFNDPEGLFIANPWYQTDQNWLNFSLFWGSMLPGPVHQPMLPLDPPKVPCPPTPSLPPGIAKDQLQKMIDATQDFYSKRLVADPETASSALMGFLTGNFAPGGSWDYKKNYSPGSDKDKARVFGNFAFGAVMQSLGMTYYQTQNAAGVAQIGICLLGGACGEGVPFFKWPYGDQPVDAKDIKKGYDYEQRKASGDCP